MRLSDLLFGPARETAAQVLARFPARPLPPGAMVTRFAPSPTGFMHIGGLYAALISCLLARRSDGVFFLRIEDTDKVREIDGAVELIVQSLAEFGVVPSEGEVEPGREVGAYGPYRQSVEQREQIRNAALGIFHVEGAGCTDSEPRQRPAIESRFRSEKCGLPERP